MNTLAKRRFESETGLPWSDASYLPWLEKLVEEKFTSTNSAMVPCPKWINCDGDVCFGDPFKEKCGDSPCLVLAQHQ